MAALQERLQSMLEPLVEAMGYELVLLEFSSHRGSALVRLFIDAVGGVTLGDCERVSREVEGVLDVEDPIPQNYRLEVSSPGLDRPLVKPAHFERFAGSVARVQLLAPRNGRRKFQGVLRGLRNEQVVLDTPDAGTVEVALGEIERARLVPEYELTDSAAPNRRAKELSGS
jgi:ribosome maturation factor RimP